VCGAAPFRPRRSAETSLDRLVARYLHAACIGVTRDRFFVDRIATHSLAFTGEDRALGRRSALRGLDLTRPPDEPREKRGLAGLTGKACPCGR
jgi:hypothetical protein